MAQINSFKHLYTSVRKNYRSIVELSDSEVDKIHNSTHKYLSSRYTLGSIYNGFMLLLTLYFIIIYHKMVARTIYVYISYCRGLDKIFLHKNSYYIPEFIIAFFFLTLFNTLNSKNHIGYKDISSGSGYNVKVIPFKDFEFKYFYIFCFCYVFVGIMLFLLFYIKLDISIYYSILYYYILIPLDFIGAFIILFILVFWSYFWVFPRTWFNNDIRIEMIMIFLNAIYEIDGLEDAYKKSPDSIYYHNIFWLTKSISFNKEKILIYFDSVKKKHEKIETAIEEFTDIDKYEAINNKEYLTKIKNNLILYLNSFLKEQYTKLPINDNIIIEDKPSQLKLRAYVGLGIYLCLPLLIALYLVFFSKYIFTDFEKNIFKLLYFVWVFIGLIKSPVITKGENSKFIKDLIGNFFGGR